MTASGIQRSKYDKGVYIVRGQEWAVGERYTLTKMLGEGSFSQVCLAQDNILGELVALKRIADVLNSVDYAKRVLREICILRRIRHPNMIGLLDAFTKPSSTGRLKYKEGKLIPMSIDLYLALEYANGGDLFHLKGQLSEQDVKHMMWQLTNTMKFLHDQHVWHRDLKSANVLLNIEDGLRVLKIADLGSARSATRTGYNVAEQKAPVKTTIVEEGNKKLGRTQRLESMDSMANIPQLTPDIFDQQMQQLKNGVIPPPLTRVICTPCYRAPEVVMSRGGYTSAIDIWSLGCIFGELLHRVARLGSASTPQLQISPVFAIYGEQGMMKTPETGERFTDGPSCPTTRKELEALFQVIGTPTWACIDGVQSTAWKKYLQKLPLFAPTLSRRFGKAGEIAVDLLRRLLTFDPQRRPSAEEVLTHEYFMGCAQDYESFFEDPCLLSMQISQEIALPKDPNQRHYFNVKDPAKALATLEDELEKLVLVEDGVDRVRNFIEMECSEIQKEREVLAALSPEERCCEVFNNSSFRPSLKRDSPGTPRQGKNRFLRNKSLSHMGDPHEWQGLQIDPNPLDQDASLLGEDRVKRDGYSARSKLDVEEHLYRGRMADWTATTGKDLERDNGSRWGVSFLPPGMDHGNMDPNMLQVISSQQAR